MSDAVKVGFVPFSAAPRGVLVVFCDDALKFGEATRKALGKAADTVKRAAAANQFKGKSGSTLDIPAPEGIKAERLIVVGVGKAADIKEKDFLKFGGVTAGKLNAASEAVTVIAELPDGAMQADAAAAIASGIRLRAYKFDRYKTKKKDGENGALRADVSIAVDDVAAARKAFAPASHVVDGVIIARELVNEPPNVLYPVEFARRAEPAQEARRRGRGARRQGDDEARHGRAARRRAGLDAARPHRDHALERRQEGRAAGCLRRQGRLLRYRRHFHQGRRQHGGHEGRHGRRGLRGRADACAGGAQGEGQRGRRHRPGREHARRQRPAPRRHRHLDVGADHRDHQHRRRRPARAGRRALVRGEEVQAEIHGRSGDADRRDHGRARHRICRHVLQQRRTGGTAEQDRNRDRRARLAHAARSRIRQADRFAVCRHEEHRRRATAVRSPPRSSCSASSTTRRGRISTSREPRWARRKPTSTTVGVRATAFACWTGWSRNITKPRSNLVAAG